MRGCLRLRRVEEVLVELIKAYTPTGEEERGQKVLVEICKELGLDVQVDGAGNVIARKGGGGRVWLVGHYDTVPGELPISLNDYVAGRGAVDAKGPLAAMLVAASTSDVPVTVAALVGEEGDSRGARNLDISADYVIIGEPSNVNGVIIAYRGGAHLRLTCRGRGGHSSSPGDSALDKLLKAITAFKLLAPGKSYEDPSAAVTVIRAGHSFNVLPTLAEAEVDLRVPPGLKVDEVISRMRDSLEDGCSLEVRWSVPPVRVSPSDPVPRALIRSILKAGMRPRLLKKYGGSDMNILHEKVKSIAAYGPGDGRLAHTNEERVSVEDLRKAVLVYREAVRELARKPTP